VSARDFRARAGLVLAVWALAGCARGSGRAPVQGDVPAATAHVGAITLPEVHAGGADSPFRLTPAAGHVLVVYFGYTTCPDVCPTTLSDLHRALASMGDDARRVDVAFVTVDRERDTPAQLAPYLAAFVAGGHPLRPASDAELASAEEAFGASSSISRTPGGDVEVSHTGTMYVVDASGKIAVEWPFGTKPPLMAHDLSALLARGGKSAAIAAA